MGIREWRRVVVVQQLIDSHGGPLLSPGNNRNSVVLLSVTSVTVWCPCLLADSAYQYWDYLATRPTFSLKTSYCIHLLLSY